LCPVDLSPLGIERDSDAPSGLVAAVGVPMARLDKRLDLRTIEIRAHDSHPFAIRPIKLAVLLIEMELLWGERAAFPNDEPAVLSVDVGALVLTVVLGRNAHVGPVDMTCFDVHGDAVRVSGSGY